MRKILLLVDDEPSILRSLQRIFRRTDYEVLTAESGAKALELIQEHPVAVLMSDYAMPGLVGADLLSKARELRPEMSRIVLSGNNDQESVIRSINDGGALKFLTKPWDTEKLITEVDAAYSVWAEKQYSLDMVGLLNQVAFVEEVQQELDSPSGETIAVVNLQIRDLESIRQILKLNEEREFLRHYLTSQEPLQALNSDSQSVFGLMDDGSFCAVLMLDAVSDVRQAISSLLGEFSETVEYRSNTFQIRLDAGYALSGEIVVAEELMRNAFTALNRAITSGDEEFVGFDTAMHDSNIRRFTISEQLTSALPNDEFVLYYQPKIKTSNQTLHGAEALIRWNSKALGLVSPFDFIPLAEESDLINDIGQWVMETAAGQWNSWFAVGQTDARVSVNVSPRQLRDKRFVQRVAGVIDSIGLAPSSFELEITESVMMQDINSAKAMLREISDLGIKLSIDDFGTGYSSLNYLHELPVDVIKIDRSFITPLIESRECQSLVRNLISLGQDLNMEIVAEGVEDSEQLDMLLGFGCDVIQGYFYSPPVAAEDFAALMKTYPVQATHDTPLMEYKKAG